MTQFPFEQVLIAIPAHNEQDLLKRALDAVLASVAHLRLQRTVQIAVGVVAHRCTDDTFAVATNVLGQAEDIDVLVTRDNIARSIGEVRHRLIMRLAEPQSAPSMTWVFSTDADSVVPQTWLSGVLQTAERADALAVAGLTELIDWSAGRREREAYETLLASGLTADGGHNHAYAANLAVRLDAYLAAGGFPNVESGEEHQLLKEIRANGGLVATPREPKVQTSGRTPGRADHGLANLLERL